MNLNGDHSQSGYVLENHRGNTSNRYRGGHRRNRGRGGQDKSGQSRNFRERKPGSNWRDNSRPSEVIDLQDSSQWPSIQESSLGVPNRRSQTSPRSPETFDKEKQESTEPLNRPSRFGSGQQNVPYFREHSGRYSGRGRGSRYNGPNRYSSNYNRRFSRGNYQNSSYIPDPLMTSYFNGHLLFGPGFPAPPPAPHEPVPKEVDPIKQVEFYFSTANLEYDFYMRSQMDQDGWVDLAVVFKFNRIQTLGLEFEAFTKLLVDSQLLDVDLEKKRVRTKNEPEKWVLGPDSKQFYSPRPDQHLSNNAQFNDYAQNGYFPPPVPHFPPMFVPFSNFSTRAGRYGQQYGFYPGQYYGAPYIEGSTDIPTPFYPPEYSANYFPYPYPSHGYYETTPRSEEVDHTTELTVDAEQIIVAEPPVEVKSAEFPEQTFLAESQDNPSCFSVADSSEAAAATADLSSNVEGLSKELSNLNVSKKGDSQ